MEAFIFYPLTPRATILQRGIAAFFRIHDGFGTLMGRPSDDADDVTWGVYHRFFGDDDLRRVWYEPIHSIGKIIIYYNSFLDK
jgi:hypothetical protein